MLLKSLLAASLAALLVVADVGTVTPHAAESSVAPAPAPRPLILLVHGRGHGGLDTAMLRRSWERTLSTAAAGLIGRSPFTSGDVSLVWYADALDPRTEARCTAERRAQQPARAAMDEPLAALLGISSMILAALTTDIEGETVRELRNLAAEMQFFGDPERRCAAEEQVGSALIAAHRDGRPVILVAHSMGALVSWSYLTGRADAATASRPPVRRLVTLGSPVGSPEIRQLLGGGSPGLALPPSVESWVNVVDARDPFAVPLGAGMQGLTDISTQRASDADPHAIEHYLRDPATVTVVLEAWCGAIEPSARPQECERLAPR